MRDARRTWATLRFTAGLSAAGTQQAETSLGNLERAWQEVRVQITSARKDKEQSSNRAAGVRGLLEGNQGWRKQREEAGPPAEDHAFLPSTKLYGTLSQPGLLEGRG